MNMKEAVTSVLVKKYATIEGRASRSEYWWFSSILSFGQLLLCVLDAGLGGSSVNLIRLVNNRES